MTEYDLFVACIPMIVEIIIKCRKLTTQQYEGWKQKTLENTPITQKSFVGKLFIVIDDILGNGVANGKD